jgi:thiamine monophosphate kinase
MLSPRWRVFAIGDPDIDVAWVLLLMSAFSSCLDPSSAK